MRWGLPCVLSPCLALACGPSAGSGSSSGSSSESGSDTDDPTATSTSGVTASGSTTGMSDGTVTGDACPPITPEVVTASFTIDPEPPMGRTQANCVVTGLTHHPTSSAVELACDAPGGPTPVTLTYGTIVHVEPLLSVDQPVILDTIYEPVFWINRWFALRDALGEQPWLIAAGVEASWIDPPDMTIDAFLEQPQMVVVDGVCEPVATDCGDEQRMAIDFGYADDWNQVLSPGDGIAGQLGGYLLALERATRIESNFQCTDLPGEWFDLVVEWVPEG